MVRHRHYKGCLQRIGTLYAHEKPPRVLAVEGVYLLLDDLKLFDWVAVELVHRYLAVRLVPIPEKFPTEADAYARPDAP